MLVVSDMRDSRHKGSTRGCSDGCLGRASWPSCSGTQGLRGKRRCCSPHDGLCFSRRPLWEYCASTARVGIFRERPAKRPSCEQCRFAVRRCQLSRHVRSRAGPFLSLGEGAGARRRSSPWHAVRKNGVSVDLACPGSVGQIRAVVLRTDAASPAHACKAPRGTVFSVLQGAASAVALWQHGPARSGGRARRHLAECRA